VWVLIFVITEWVWNPISVSNPICQFCNPVSNPM
jgi:hypothetical protein